MATRLIGTESTDPWLPDVVKVKADKTKLVDAAGHFTASDVEGALAELAVSGGGGGSGEGSGIVIDDEPPTETDVLWADTSVEGTSATIPDTINVHTYTDPVDPRPDATVVFWIPDPYNLANPFAAEPGDCVLRSTPNVVAGLNGVAALWQGTAAEYDAIATPSSDTVYFVLEDPLP